MTKRLTGSRAGNAVIIVAVLLIPLMYSGLLTWAYEKPLTRVSNLKAAVVNLDNPVTAQFTTGSKTLDLGAQLEEQLYSDDAPGFDWTKASLSEAQSGLADGSYRALLLIPSDFSANFSQLADPENTDVRSTTLQLQTDDSVNYLEGTMATSVSSALESIVSGQGASQYIDQILLAFGPFKAGLDEGAQGASQLAEGSTQLESGSAELADGAAELTSGALSADSGVKRLADGSLELKTGTDTLVVGLGDLVSGAAQLQDGTLVLSNGAKAAKVGSDQLAAGIKQYTDGTTQLVAGISQVSDGAQTLYQAAQQTDAGVQQLNQGAQQLSAGVDQAASAAGQLSSGASSLLSSLSASETGSTTIKDGTLAVKQMVTQLVAACQLLPSDPICLGLTAQLGENGLETLTAQVEALDQGVDQAAAGASQLASGAQQLQLALSQPGTADDPTLKSGIDQIIAQTQLSTTTGASPTLRDGTSGILSGLETLVSGAEQLEGGGQELNQSSGTLNSASSELSEGLGSLQDGTQEVYSGSISLLNGAQSAQTGAVTLADGSGTLYQGVVTLKDGTKRLATGAELLSTGAKELNAGSTQLKDGSTQLATALSAGADEVPEISVADAETISSVAGQPVQVKQVRNHEVSENGIGFAPFFVALSLWIGGIALFLVFPALDIRRLKTEPFFICGLRSLATTIIFGLIQSAVAIIGLQLLLNLQAKNLGTLLLICMFTSLVFVSINQACVALLGFRGRFVSILLLCLQLASSGATFPIETTAKFLQGISKLLPMTYAAQAIRNSISGGTQSVVPMIVVLSIWLLFAWTITFISSYRRKGMLPMPFDPALAFPSAENHQDGSSQVPVILHDWDQQNPEKWDDRQRIIYDQLQDQTKTKRIRP